jgi:3D (Asp-Asp-Asp) domain-containing protein
MFLAKSLRRKALATAVAAVTFVITYEVTMLDVRSGGDVAAEGPMTAPGPGERATFIGTAYCKGVRTASGVAVRSGVVAADPALLPAGSVVEIDAPDARYDGIYTVLDTGPAVQGPVIDIYMWSCHDALRFGRKQMAVTVLRRGWNPSGTAPGYVGRLGVDGPARRLNPPTGILADAP